VHLSVGDLEPDVSDAGRRGEPPRFGYLDPGKVRAQGMPAAGGAGRRDGHITAPASDVENVLPVRDLRGGQQPGLQPTQHPLMPLALLDELPPAGPVPGLGLLRIHRHLAQSRASVLGFERVGGRPLRRLSLKCALDRQQFPPLVLAHRRVVRVDREESVREDRGDADPGRRVGSQQECRRRWRILI
jgi:hypothetical protein